MYYLLNSALMVSEGRYELRKISPEQFFSILKVEWAYGNLKSYIGYQVNLDIIKEKTGISLEPTREEIKDLRDGDILLIMKLKYRLSDVKLKADKEFQSSLGEGDFDYYIAHYKSF